MKEQVTPRTWQRRLRKKKIKTLKAVRPNIGIEAAYRQRLRKLIETMHNSIQYWIEATYKSNQPAITDVEPSAIIFAQDAVPAAELRKAIRKLIRRWRLRFDQGAPKLAKWFSESVNTRSDKALERILRDAGFSVRFKMTPAQRDILHATVNQNVSLIKSIPQQYLNEVEGMVMRSVQVGGDLSDLSKQLKRRYRITQRRAELIARDQNNKATSALNRARQLEIGINKAIWLHSGGGKEPRPTHVANSGKEYDVDKGWYDPHEGIYIHPGQLINCRCVCRAVVPGFS